jgi:hypothetical protein
LPYSNSNLTLYEQYMNAKCNDKEFLLGKKINLKFLKLQPKIIGLIKKMKFSYQIILQTMSVTLSIKKLLLYLLVQLI